MKPILQIFGLMAFAVVMFNLAVEVHIWEATNNYPYGKLCDLFNNCN